jgi:hypothetical protein
VLDVTRKTQAKLACITCRWADVLVKLVPFTLRINVGARGLSINASGA